MSIPASASDTLRLLSTGKIIGAAEPYTTITHNNPKISLADVTAINLQQIQQTDQILQYALVLEKEFDTAGRLTQDIIALEDAEQTQLTEFSRAEEQLDTLLVNEIEAGNLDARVVVDINGDSGRKKGGGAEDGTHNNSAVRSSSNNSSNSISRRSHFASEELVDLSHSFNSMTEKLRAADRMQKEFLGIASHELRSPIQPILSYADLVIKGDIPCEQAIETIFAQALRLQILGNAAKFTKKGKIKIEASRLSEASLIEIRISDTGGGIPKEILPRLFEKFATKDVGASARQGTGLWLYISKAIIDAHNGKISAFNNSEGGATFVVCL